MLQPRSQYYVAPGATLLVSYSVRRLRPRHKRECSRGYDAFCRLPSHATAARRPWYYFERRNVISAAYGRL